MVIELAEIRFDFCLDSLITTRRETGAIQPRFGLVDGPMAHRLPTLRRDSISRAYPV